MRIGKAFIINSPILIVPDEKQPSGSDHEEVDLFENQTDPIPA
jgi:hypothetical protein